MTFLWRNPYICTLGITYVSKKKEAANNINMEHIILTFLTYRLASWACEIY